ncbi:MAG: hypothetical protein LC623_06875, partial [Halobacteriales archaeon]|nr:hypothetical protein [Halobacteriales archaeon]
MANKDATGTGAPSTTAGDRGPGFEAAVLALRREWEAEARWQGVQRDYGAHDVVRLRGSLHFDYPVARHGANRLWRLLNEEPYVPALGAVTGNQAIQMAKAGLKA